MSLHGQDGEPGGEDEVRGKGGGAVELSLCYEKIHQLPKIVSLPTIVAA